MSLTRILEPEVMDTPEDASDYDSMDHQEVNRRFVDDLLAAGLSDGDVLDLGTGTARIPIELCQRLPDCRIMAADAAIAMLDLGRLNIELAGLITRITLTHLDAKSLPFPDHSFATVISNSIIHHIPSPLSVLQEAVRVTTPGGLLFFRDLLRPADERQLQELVTTYAGAGNNHQRQLFEESLHAALDLSEIQALISQIGFDPAGVRVTSDRHWTWVARRPA